jgi:hypothetical protein
LMSSRWRDEPFEELRERMAHDDLAPLFTDYFDELIFLDADLFGADDIHLHDADALQPNLLGL